MDQPNSSLPPGNFFFFHSPPSSFKCEFLSSASEAIAGEGDGVSLKGILGPKLFLFPLLPGCYDVTNFAPPGAPCHNVLLCHRPQSIPASSFLFKQEVLPLRWPFASPCSSHRTHKVVRVPTHAYWPLHLSVEGSLPTIRATAARTPSPLFPSASSRTLLHQRCCYLTSSATSQKRLLLPGSCFLKTNSPPLTLHPAATAVVPFPL